MSTKNHRPIFTVAKFEIVRQLKKPSFWVALLLMPVMIFGLVAISALSGYKAGEASQSGIATNDKTLGLTDDAHIIRPELLQSSDDSSPRFTIYPDRESGIEAVKTGKTDIFYYIPADFSSEVPIEYFSSVEQSSLMANYEIPLRSLLYESAASHVDPTNIAIISNSYNFAQTTIDAEGKSVNLLGKAIVPLAILAVFYILVCVFGNRMLMTVVEEKENRISEMILTAVSAKHLIIGKIIALIILGFLQIIVFITPIICIILLNQSNPLVSQILKIIEIDPPTIIANLALLIFSYFLFAGFSTFVGSLVPTARDASQYISPIIIGVMLPIIFLDTFMTGTTNAFLYFLSYFPLSAPIALMLRNTFGTLPWPELLIGLAELTICSIIIIRLTIKSFQANAINFSVVKPNFKPKKTWKTRTH